MVIYFAKIVYISKKINLLHLVILLLVRNVIKGYSVNFAFNHQMMVNAIFQILNGIGYVENVYSIIKTNVNTVFYYHAQ